MADKGKKWETMHSTGKDDWQTPLPIFEALDREFGFKVDVAASDENHLCAAYYTKRDDALSRSWSEGCDHMVAWCNPPYSRKVGEWLAKGAEEAAKGVTSVFLIMARTETKWWHEYIMKYASEVRLVEGRIHYVDPSEPRRCEASPAPAAIIIFRAFDTGPPRFKAWPQPETEKTRVKEKRKVWSKMKREEKKRAEQ